MKRVTFLFLFGALLLSIMIVSACSTGGTGDTLNNTDVLSTAQAANPLPTEMAGLGLQMTQSDACLIKEDASITIDDKQGDLLAWSPVNDEIAYVRPDNGRWAWFVGDLVMYDIDLNKEVYTSSDLQVFGDLTWSPDGNAIAYVVLDSTRAIYTARVLNILTGADVDIFAGTTAKTDDWSSTKGVTNWASERNVVVTSSCGLDCARIYNYNIETGVITINGEERKNEDPSLALDNEMTSPDGTYTLAVDTQDNLWMANGKTGKAFILLAATPVEEIKWSVDSRFIALRTAEKIQVYQVGCKNE